MMGEEMMGEGKKEEGKKDGEMVGVGKKEEEKMDEEKKVYDIRNQPFYIGRKKTEKMNMSQCHYHNVYEIYYLVEGRRNYFIHNRSYPVEKGDLVLLNIHDIHKTMEAGQASHERILIYFKPDFIAPLIDPNEGIDLLKCFQSEHKVIHLKIPDQTFVQSILLKMMDEDRKKTKGYMTYQRILLVELLLFMNRFLEQYSQEGIGYNSQLHKKMSVVAQYLMEHYMEKLSLKAVADHFYITSCHLSRSFKKTTGFTYIEYLNSIRIKEAQKLLKETRKSVMQIAELTGFDSQTHFGRVYKSITGLSPLQYRKQPGI